MKKLKISIRLQLTILVCLVSILSLVILAIVTGVYFSNNLGDLRAEKLEVIAQLKATQVEQAFSYLYYQVYWLSSRDSITTSLTSYKAGNTSYGIWDSPSSTIDQFLDSSEIFTNARLYDLSFDPVVDADSTIFTDNAISNETLSVLFPLRDNVTNSRSVLREGGLVIPPILNDTTFFMSLTFPIYGNTSFLISKPDLSGYLTVVMNAESLRTVSNDSSAVQDGQISIVRPVHNVSSDYDNYTNISTMVAFQYVFPPGDDLVTDGVTLELFDINSYSVVKDVFTHNSTGSATQISNPFGERVAVGYSIASLTFTDWAVLVEQKRSTFVAPVLKLRNIIIGVVLGICVMLCILIFPIAFWFVGPIRKLKMATEIITKHSYKNDSKNEKNGGVTTGHQHGDGNEENRYSVNSSMTFRIPPRISTQNRIFKDELTELTETFNIMTDELEKQYLHLEHRVKSRTKELEASKIEAESANEAKTVFIANISHELRTPLNGILGMTAIAMAERDPSKIQDSLKLIYRSGELLLHILTELLTFSKNTLKRSKLEKRDFQILEITNQVKSIFGKLALDQRVNFTILIKPKLIRKMVLFGDSNRIIQVVMNLVSNALKFTPVDGRVDVGIRVLGRYDFVKSKEGGFKKVYVVEKSGLKSEELSDNNNNSNNDDDNNNNNNEQKGEEYVDEKNVAKPEVPANEEIINEHIKEDENFENFENVDKDLEKSDDSDVQSFQTLSTTEYNDAIFDSQFEKPLPLPPIPAKKPNLPSRNSKMSVITTTTTNRESRTSIGAPESEIEQNNNIYKTKKLKQQKTWVVEITVEDTGPGIEPALQQKVFEPFIQGDQTLSRSYGGTGLGLSICRQLAAMMHGTLTLESSLGVGSKFIFTVPLTQTREVLVDDEKAFYEDEFNIDSKSNRRVVIEDDNDNTVINDSSGSDYHDLSSGGSLNHHPNTNGAGGKHKRNGSLTIREDYIDEKYENQDTFPNNHPLQRSLSNNSRKKLQLKLDSKAKSSYFDSPHLFTNSSTGTANSASDKESNGFNPNVQLKILVAEDNLVNQEVIKRMLRLEGFTNITLACDGHEAVEYVRESVETSEFYDIIFMDVQMPKIDGLLATKMIRNNLLYTRPIVALTAFADESNVKECLQNGMSGFLPKPIRRAQLRKIITEFCPIVLGEMVPTPSEETST